GRARRPSRRSRPGPIKPCLNRRPTWVPPPTATAPSCSRYRTASSRLDGTAKSGSKRGPHRLHDRPISRAPAQVARQKLAGGCLSRILPPRPQGGGHDQLPGGAGAALEPLVLDERLDQVRLAPGDALRGPHLCPLGAPCEVDAGADRIAIDQHCAGPADANPTAFPGAPEPTPTDEVEEQGAAWCFRFELFPVEEEGQPHDTSSERSRA